MPDAVIVVPCFNEEGRLRDDEFLALAAEPGIRLLFVDDGSSDGTATRVRGVGQRAPGRIDLFQLEKNSGKAEAVRRGLLRALKASPAVVGYVDADLSTPVSEIVRLHRAFDSSSNVQVVMGAR